MKKWNVVLSYDVQKSFTVEASSYEKAYEKAYDWDYITVNDNWKYKDHLETTKIEEKIKNMLNKNKPFITINLDNKLIHEYKYGILNNILHLDIPLENSDKTLTVNFEIKDIMSLNGFDIKKMFVSEKTSVKE